MENENQIIIELLRKQNETLHQLLEFHLKKDRQEHKQAIINFVLHAIPYIAMFILLFIIYTTFKSYLDALNNNINAMRDGFLALQDSIGKLIPDFGAITETLENTWQQTRNLF